MNKTMYDTVLTWVLTVEEVGVKWLSVLSEPPTLPRSRFGGGNQTHIHTYTLYFLTPITANKSTSETTFSVKPSHKLNTIIIINHVTYYY